MRWHPRPAALLFLAFALLAQGCAEGAEKK